MGEAKKKPTEFSVDYYFSERVLMEQILTADFKCVGCKSGPLEASDPVKVLRFGKLWDILRIEEIQEMKPHMALLVKDRVDEKEAFTLTTDLFRYQMEIMLGRLQVNSLFLLRMVKQIIDFAEANRIALPTMSLDEDVSDEDLRQLKFTAKERTVVWLSLVNPVRCQSVVSFMNGTQAFHNAPIDNPYTVAAFKDYIAVFEKFDFMKKLFSVDDVEDAPSDVGVVLPLKTFSFLSELLSRRSGEIGGAKMVFSLVKKLEDLKTGTNKFVDVVPPKEVVVEKMEVTEPPASV